MMRPRGFKPRVASLQDLGLLQPRTLTQQQLADRIGTHRSAVGRDETKPDALQKMSVGRLARHLSGLGYRLALVAVPVSADARQEVIELRECRELREGDEPAAPWVENIKR